MAKKKIEKSTIELPVYDPQYKFYCLEYYPQKAGATASVKYDSEKYSGSVDREISFFSSDLRYIAQIHAYESIKQFINPEYEYYYGRNISLTADKLRVYADKTMWYDVFVTFDKQKTITVNGSVNLEDEVFEKLMNQIISRS